MILCVTLNPCLDKTLVVPPWRPGDAVRGLEVHQVVGGKGNNVARALSRLGHDARPVTFLGGPTGVLCEHLLRREDQFDPIIASTESSTRVILTVRTEESAEQTAFFDPDPVITPPEAEDLLRRVERTLSEGSVEALTLSGSSPGSSTHGLFSDLICAARSRRVPIFLDTYGPALEAIWGFWPEVIHVNRREAGVYLGKSRPSDEELFTLLSHWTEHGVKCGVITDGPGAVLIRHDDTYLRALPPQIDPINPIGSGDCLVAGLVDGWLAQRSPEDLLRRGLACAIANALTWDAGDIDLEAVRQWEPELTFESAEAEAAAARPARPARLSRNIKR
jgi:1-phosphofructokinase family hexose kinase